MKRLASLLLLSAALAAGATETENVDFRIVRAPGAVAVDAEFADWILAGSIFCCPDVESFRSSYGVWIAAMFDSDNLYFLFRWLDQTPMNNPGLAGSDYPWQGDCMQARLATSPQSRTVWNDLRHNTDTSRLPMKFAHFDLWRDRNGVAAAGATLAKDAQPKGDDMVPRGVKEAFREVPGGYVQEVAIPWSLICDGAYRPASGDFLLLTFEPNYRTTGDQRLTTKDFFRKGVQPDRAMTFMRPDVWGRAEFVDRLGAPQPLRLADGRTLPVSMKDGVPEVDWRSLKVAAEKPGFLPIRFTLAEPGEVSVVVKNAAGEAVAWPLSAQPLPAGAHEFLWNGLSACFDSHVGEPVPAGRYTWEGIVRKPLHLELEGWAHGAGPNPYDVAGGGWGGDHGDPCAVACDAERVYLGWERAEAGWAVVAADYDGNLLWHHKRGGFGTARSLAADRAGHLYVYDAGQGNIVYRLDAAKGAYDNFPGTSSAELPLAPFGLGEARRMRFADGRLELAFEKEVVSIAVANLKDVKRRPAKPEDLAARAVAPDGTVYAATGAPDHRILVSKGGREVRRIGRQGGRRLSGKWDPDGVYNVADLALDDAGFLWVAEKDSMPRRVSKWNAATGALADEFFGATVYGALGGAVCPSDPRIVVGQGCEWRLDGKSPRAKCVGTVARDAGWGCSRFGRGPKGEVYLAVAGWWMGGGGNGVVKIFQRLGEADWRLRATISQSGKGFRAWADENGDAAEQPNEVRDGSGLDIGSWITGWYMAMNPAMTWFSGRYVIPVAGWTKCGAPIYDPAKVVRMSDEAAKHAGGMGATAGVVSEDGRFAIYNAQYNTQHSASPCYEVATGRRVFAYPNCYVGVHGGHSAPSARRGLIRAAYDFIGTAKCPEPLGNVFAIGTDKGEWHLLSDKGLYVGRLFEPDPMRVEWPAEFRVGTRLDRTPPGQGSEDFGGSMTRADDGSLHVLFGKTAFIVAKVAGLESAKALPGGAIDVKPADVATAQGFAAKLRSGALRSPTCDFEPEEDEAAVAAEPFTATARCEGGRIRFEFDVTDRTPWVNGASDFRNLYAMGDTVDFQLADANGDLRLSVGPLGGRTAAAPAAPKPWPKRPVPAGEFACELSFPSAPAAPLADFPVLVRLSDGAPAGFSYADCPKAENLWFTDETGAVLPFEADTWNDKGESLVWVSVPSLSSPASVTMHWSDRPAASPAPSEVWSRAGYVGVWHMNELLADAAAGTHYTPDSSASGWNAYKANEADAYPAPVTGAGAAASAPPTGRAMANQRGDDGRMTGGFLVPASATSGTTIGPFTVSFFEATENTGNDRVVAFGAAFGEMGNMTAAASETYVMNGGNAYRNFRYDDGLPGNAWRHVAGVYDAEPSAYVGGAPRPLGVRGWNVSKTLAKGIGLGTFVNHTETFRGDLDEIRIRNAASTAAWIAEENRTATDARYVVFGAVEKGVAGAPAPEPEPAPAVAAPAPAPRPAGVATAALYKQTSRGEKAPHTFYSGVYRDGVTWDLVKEIPVEAAVEKRADGYRIVFSVAEKDLGLAAPLAGRAAKGDFGVTFGDAAGKDTVLRAFRFDKAAGIVSDEVEELKIHPANWGDLQF